MNEFLGEGIVSWYFKVKIKKRRSNLFGRAYDTGW